MHEFTLNGAHLGKIPYLSVSNSMEDMPCFCYDSKDVACALAEKTNPDAIIDSKVLKIENLMLDKKQTKQSVS